MKKRKRITKTNKTESDEKLEGINVFEENCASPNAKFIYKYKDFEIEI